MPSGTDVHVGFFWPQSKQTYEGHPVSAAVSGPSRRAVEGGRGKGGADLVGGLRLELLKDLERLLLGREAAHGGGNFGRCCLLVSEKANSARAVENVDGLVVVVVIETCRGGPPFRRKWAAFFGLPSWLQPLCASPSVA